jgi:hypothetical protein
MPRRRRYEDGVPDTENPVYRAIKILCGELPFLLGYYDHNWGFCLSPQNPSARSLIGKNELLSEAELICWRHALRRRPIERYNERALLNRHRPSAAPSTPASVPQLLTKLDGGTWPGEEISRRHRMWGFHFPAVDIDMLLIDSNDGEPCGLFEFKHECAAPIRPGDPNIAAAKAFADVANLPFHIVRYRQDPLIFWIEQSGEMFGAEEWVHWLRSLRRRGPRPLSEIVPGIVSSLDERRNKS